MGVWGLERPYFKAKCGEGLWVVTERERLKFSKLRVQRQRQQNTVGSNGASIIGDAPATNMGCSGGT